MSHKAQINSPEIIDLIAESVSHAKTRRKSGTNSEVAISSLSDAQAEVIAGGYKSPQIPDIDIERYLDRDRQDRNKPHPNIKCQPIINGIVLC